jgi:hypothetical protein
VLAIFNFRAFGANGTCNGDNNGTNNGIHFKNEQVGNPYLSIQSGILSPSSRVWLRERLGPVVCVFLGFLRGFYWLVIFQPDLCV